MTDTLAAADGTDLAIETSGLVKTFGETRAIDGVDLAVPAGAVYGFLGPNGAGKTTTIRVLATLLRPDAGTARVLGHDVVHILVFAFSLSWIFTALGLVLHTPTAVTGVSMPVLFPFVFASNLFVDPGTMPGWLQAIVDVNPFSLTVTATRGLMDGDATAGEIGWVLLSCAVIVAVFAPLTMHLYRTKQ